jgi:hypothetical protein
MGIEDWEFRLPNLGVWPRDREDELHTCVASLVYLTPRRECCALVGPGARNTRSGGNVDFVIG